MGKKVYKMTEDQVASILGKKKESTIAEIPAPGLQLSTEGEKKKTKYKITEDQLKRIFNELGSKAIDEMDNYNYPMGSDTPDAPWNRDDSDNTRAGETVDGNYVAVANSKYDFILKDKQNNQLYYTMTDFWDDIYDDLFDYLDVAQEEDADEDGRYMSTASDWKDYITGDDILSALPSYLNDNAKRGIAIDAVDTISRWEDGENKFLMLNPETIEAIESDEIKNKAKGLLGLN